MVKEFEGYWAVILGGSSGLGLASAQKLAHHGMNICIVHRNSRAQMTEINQTFDTIRGLGVEVMTLNADINDEAKREQLLNELKDKAVQVRCLLHSIAKGHLKPLKGEHALTKEDFNLTLDYMALSLQDWTAAIFEKELFAQDARVLAFTSQGSQRAWNGYAAVGAAKATLEALVRNIALEYAAVGIRANSIMAGVVETQALKAIPGSEKLMALAKENSPFQRLTTSEDVADVVYLLCKDEAAWITGAVIPVDGGLHLS